MQSVDNIMPIDTRAAAPLVVAISSGALFRLEESDRVFEERGLDGYAEYQVEHENALLSPGVAFPLAKKLLSLNKRDAPIPAVEVVLLSRNSADTGLRIFNSIEHFGLDIQRAAFTGGHAPHRYMPAFGAQLFLSTNTQYVRRALEAGFAAAQILPSAAETFAGCQLRIAFDGDAVIFGDESEQLYQRAGLEVFAQSEKDAAAKPLSGGPFRPLLEALQKIQSAYSQEECPIRTALVTARGAPAHKRVILTLRRWGVRIDEALFLGGKTKAGFLRAFGADIFFDDQMVHCDEASKMVTTGHVPNGIVNRK